MFLLPNFLTENQHNTSPYGDTYQSNSAFSLHLITVSYDKTWEFSLHHRVQTGSGAHPASHPVGTGGKAVGA
jgi:hypothetical protein